MAAGSPLLNGLEVAGPYMFLLAAAVGLVISWGLLHLQNWARRAAIVIAMTGAVLLIPVISGDVVEFQIGRLAWSGLQIVVRVLVVFYLYQKPVQAAF
jgi:hypothetical protein